MLHSERILAVVESAPRHAEVIHQAHRWADMMGASLEIYVLARQANGVDSLRAVVERSRDAAADFIIMPHPTTGRSYEQLGLGVLRHVHQPVLFAKRSLASEKILAATDLSDPALPALASAWDTARFRGAKLTTVHCTRSWFDTLVATMPVSRFDLSFDGGSGPPSAATAVAALDRAHDHLGIGDKADAVVVDGPTVSSILRMSVDLRAELIVLGTHRRTGFERLLHGSVSEAVSKRAPCSCLVVALAKNAVRSRP